MPADVTRREFGAQTMLLSVQASACAGDFTNFIKKQNMPQTIGTATDLAGRLAEGGTTGGRRPDRAGGLHAGCDDARRPCASRGGRRGLSRQEYAAENMPQFKSGGDQPGDQP